MMSLPKSWLVGCARVGFERAHEDVGVEDVDAHRRERESGEPGIGGGSFGFSWKPVTRSLSSTAMMPKRLRVGDRHFNRRERHRRAALLMEAQHARVVHLVDVIARQHDQVARVLAHDRIEVLVNRVGRALIPVLADALLRRQDLDELAELLRHDAPAHADVAVQRERLVLRGDEDPPQPGVDAVAEREVDDAVRAAEVDRRLRALLRERVEPLAGAAGEDDDEPVVEQRRHRSGLAPAQHDAGWRTVRADDPQREAEHFVDARVDVAQVQPFDHDRAARRAARGAPAHRAS